MFANPLLTAGLVVVIAVLVLVLFVLLNRQGNPERAGEPQPPPDKNGRQTEPTQPPADPGAEGMSVPEPGEISSAPASDDEPNRGPTT